MIFPDKWVIFLQLKQCTQNEIPGQMGDFSALKTVHSK